MTSYDDEIKRVDLVDASRSARPSWCGNVPPPTLKYLSIIQLNAFKSFK